LVEIEKSLFQEGIFGIVKGPIGIKSIVHFFFTYFTVNPAKKGGAFYGG
jgi:hypothetical protein